MHTLIVGLWLSFVLLSLRPAYCVICLTVIFANYNYQWAINWYKLD